MGDYYSMRFKGIVKGEFRKGFSMVAMDGDWELHPDDKIRSFSNNARFFMIPCGALSYSPSTWEQGPFDEFGQGTATDGFERSYNEETGEWAFQCSLKTGSTIDHFFEEIVPYLCESLEFGEKQWEYDDYSTCYFFDEEGNIITEEIPYDEHKSAYQIVCERDSDKER